MFGKGKFEAFVVLVLITLSRPAWCLDEITGKILGGSLNSPIRIEVFSDLQCSACREFYLHTIRPVLQEYASKDKVCVIYYEFPWSYHKYAREAARYAEAASRLGQRQLLAVLDSIYTEQAQWAQDGNLDATVAKSLSRDEFQKLKKIMQDASINYTIDKQIELANKKDIRATPTMFIYYVGKQQRVDGSVAYLVMKQFIDSIVK